MFIIDDRVIPQLNIHHREIKTYVHMKTYTQMLIRASFIHVKN